ncbi:hypothetical protein ABMA28_007843 [Loxostege sticticalis]|uniref:Uncharacterized protein n=1 Tax=Loxostege sticticalis TaxID=481309 RepID=A0ABD0SJT4_LOXSC
MQWTFTCILLGSLAIISASDHGTRSKRDLSFIKRYIFSKFFGSNENDTTPVPPKANYRLFRVPGFDNILVKAVPKVPVVTEIDAPPPSIVEVTESEPVHPSIAIVSKYLGTNKLNDTLFALRGVKDLLQSGVLTAKREGIDKIASFRPVVVESSEVVVDEAQRPFMVYPTLGETIIEKYSPVHTARYPNLPIPSKYSYKQVNNGGVMTYTAHDNQNVFVTKSQRPVHFPSPISYRIQDILLMGPYHLPTSPAMHMRVKSPAPKPVFDVPKFQVPSHTPTGYSYKQVHSDGSMTTYSGSGHVEEHDSGTPVVITEIKKAPMSVVEIEGPAPIPVYNVPKVQVPFQPVKVPSQSSGYSYNQVHSDGSVTTFSGSGHVEEHQGEKSAVVITEHRRPTVVVAEVEGNPGPLNIPKMKAPSGSGYAYNHLHGCVTTNSGSVKEVEYERKPGVVITEPGRPTVVVSNVQGPPAPFPVFHVPKVKVPSGSGYSYNQVHNDGSVTTYSGTGHVEDHQGEKSAVVITEPGRPTIVVADVEGPPAPFPVFDNPNVKIHSSPGFSYDHIHNGGFVTTYSGSGRVVEHEVRKPSVVITELGRPTVVVSDEQGPPAPFPAFNVPKAKVPSGSGYTYDHVRNDGSVTTFSGSGKVIEHNRRPAVVVTEYGTPTVVVSDEERPPAPFPVLNESKVKVSSSPGYSYNQVHNDGTVTTYSGSGHVVEHEERKPTVVITEPARPTVVVADIEGPPAPFPAFNGPKANVLSGSGYSYNHVHNDGSVTTYSGSGHVVEHEERKPAVVITEPGRPTVVVSDVEGPPAPFPVFNGPKANVHSGSGYMYNHVRNDGSVTTYSGSGHVVENEERKPAVVITEPGRPTVVVSDVEGPLAAFPVFNGPQANVHSDSGYTYNHVRNDGSVTTYYGSGQVIEQEGKRPAVVITEPGRPTVVVAGVEGPPAPLPEFNGLNVKEPSSSGYTYNHMRNDGSMTTYSGSGQVIEHDGKGPGVVITKPGRPTVIVSDVEGPPAPFPVFNGSKANSGLHSGSGYTYNHMRNDGSVTTYSGSGHVVEHEERKPAVFITKPGRPTAVVSDVDGPPAPFPVFNGPKATVHSGSGYIYNHVRNDGSVTTYSGSGHVVEHEERKLAVVITEPGRPTVVVSDVEGPPAPFPVFNGSKANSGLHSGSGYTYNHMRNDGSVTTYSGSGHVVEHEERKPAVFITEPGRPTVVVSDVEGPPAPFPVFNGPKANVHSGSGYTYNHVRNDGSVTTYSGSGHVVEHEERKPAVVITEPGRPTVVVSDVEGPPAPFPVFNGPKATVHSGSGFIYNHVRNDGSVTTYSGSGQVLEHEGKGPAVVITEPGRPTIVVPDVDGPPAPFPIYNTPEVKVPSSPGYSYNHVRNDGSMLMYSGSGHVKENEGETSGVVVTETKQLLSLPTFITNRIENVVTTAMGARPPAPEHPVIVEERPDFGHNPYEMPHRLNNGEQVKGSKHSRPTSNVPSGFSYETVHQDGSVTSYTDAGGADGAHVVNDRPMLYPTGPDALYINDNLVKTKTKCKDPTHLHDGANKKGHSHAIVASKNSSFSYTTVSKGVSTTYSGSGHVNNKVDKQVDVTPIIANAPLLVTQTDKDNPEKVMLTPVLSQYSYEQINHHKPENFTVVNVGDAPVVDGQVVKVSSIVSSKSELPSVEVSEVPKDYVFMPPSTTEEPVPTKKSVEVTISSTKKAVEAVPSSSKTPLAAVPTSTKISHSFKPKRVYRKRVRTSTSSSSTRVLKTSAPLSTTPKVSSSTVETSSEGSLSANPIVVLPAENVFSFKQDRADGSSITVLGNKENKVSVVEEPKAPSRGDIPDSSY